MRWFNRRGTHDADASDAAAMRDERLSAYLDGELSTSERTALDAELAADASMREALEGMRTVQTALAGLGEVRAPRAFTLNADTLTAPAVRTARGASRLEWITRLGAIASAAACALLLTTAGGVGDFGAAGTSMSQTSAERSMAPLAAGPQPAGVTGAADATGATSTANAGAAESANDSAAPPPTPPQAPATNPLRASTPDAKSAGGAGGGIVAPGSTPAAGAALASAPPAPAASATPSAAGASSAAAASAPSSGAATPSAATASAPAAPTAAAQGGVTSAAAPATAPAVTPVAASSAQAAPPAAAPTSTPGFAARPAAPEVTRTAAAAPQPNEVTTYGTERDGTTSQIEEPGRVSGSNISTGTLAGVLAGLAAVLGVTAVGLSIVRRRD